MDQRATESELLAHAAGEFLCRPIGERREPGARQQFGDPPRPFLAPLSEQPPEEFDVLAHAQVGIEILAQPLRHIGDARADRGAVRRIGHVAIEHEGGAGLDLPSPARMLSSVDLPTPSGPIKPTMTFAGNCRLTSSSAMAAR